MFVGDDNMVWISYRVNLPLCGLAALGQSGRALSQHIIMSCQHVLQCKWEEATTVQNTTIHSFRLEFVGSFIHLGSFKWCLVFLSAVLCYFIVHIYINFYKEYLFGFETLVFATLGILSVHEQLVTLQRQRKTWNHIIWPLSLFL